MLKTNLFLALTATLTIKTVFAILVDGIKENIWQEMMTGQQLVYQLLGSTFIHLSENHSYFFSLCLLVSSAYILCKQLGPISGPTKCPA